MLICICTCCSWYWFYDFINAYIVPCRICWVSIRKNENMVKKIIIFLLFWCCNYCIRCLFSICACINCFKKPLEDFRTEPCNLIIL